MTRDLELWPLIFCPKINKLPGVNSSWNISISSLVILTAPFFDMACGRQTAAKTLYPATAVCVGSKSKLKYTTICIAHFYAKRLKCAQTWITQFYLQITPCLPLLPNRRTSPPFGWYSFYRPTEGKRLSRPGWLVTYRKIKCRLRESNPDTVTHPSTNRAQRRLTSLI